MKRYCFMQATVRLISALWILLAAAVLCPLLAKAAGEKWVNDRVTNCQIYAPEYATTAFFEGRCVQNRAHGYGSLSLYKSNELLNFVEGFFLNGIFIHTQQVEGELLLRGNDIFFHHNPADSSGFQIISPVNMTFKDSSLCNQTIFLVTNAPTASIPANRLSDALQRAADRYTTVCRTSTRTRPELATIRIMVQDGEAFRTGGAARPITATLAGNRYTVAEENLAALGNHPPPTTNTPRQSRDVAAAYFDPGLRQPASNDLIRLTMTSRLEASQEFGYPSCQAVVSIHNKDGLLVEQIAYQGLILDALGTTLYDFIERPTVPLLTGSTMTQRTKLPQAVCRQAASLRIVNIECRSGGKIVSDCGQHVEGFTARLAPTLTPSRNAAAAVRFP